MVEIFQIGRKEVTDHPFRVKKTKGKKKKLKKSTPSLKDLWPSKMRRMKMNQNLKTIQSSSLMNNNKFTSLTIIKIIIK